MNFPRHFFSPWHRFRGSRSLIRSSQCDLQNSNSFCPSGIIDSEILVVGLVNVLFENELCPIMQSKFTWIFTKPVAISSKPSQGGMAGIPPPLSSFLPSDRIRTLLLLVRPLFRIYNSAIYATTRTCSAFARFQPILVNRSPFVIANQMSHLKIQ